MGKVNRANLKKTISYLKRNGPGKTWYAVRERLEERKQPPYVWIPPSEAELERQRTDWKERGLSASFSILVPAYRTKPEYLRELLDSLCRQTYPKWELLLADATEDHSVERVAGEYTDARIRYIRLKQNGGIAENSNQVLSYITGDYAGLLDHDDVLTPDALYEMAAAIEERRRRGSAPRVLYSDEDKCNGDRTQYYEPNFKEDFNLDLLLSNNYICHFLVMEKTLIQKLKFRSKYDGAQDYDLVLRAAAELGTAMPRQGAKLRQIPLSRQIPEPQQNAVPQPGAGLQQSAGMPKAAKAPGEKGESILHIPRVLYHWRCHTGSTAENPESKRYAYEAGRRAVQDYADRAGWRSRAEDTDHVGFYRLRYEGGIFESRPDVGTVGGRLVSRGRVAGGRLTEEGKAMYAGLPVRYSGYLHRAVLHQDAYAVDLRNIQVRPECRELFRQITGVSYQTVPGRDIFDVSRLPGDCDILLLSLEFGRAVREAGYRNLYLPERTVIL